MHNLLVDMRKRGLKPWLDHEGHINLAYKPPDDYFAYLKANKRLALLEIAVEARTGVRLDLLCRDVSKHTNTY